MNKFLFGLFITVGMLIILSLTACKPTATAELPNLESANSFVIGYTLAGDLHCDKLAFSKTYTLKRTPSQFDGQATYEFEWWRPDAFSATETLTIPQNIVQSFLAKLGEAQLKDGELPRESCPNFSDIQILIYLENSMINFYQPNPCGNSAPSWNVEWSDKEDITYHIESQIPLEALEILTPYLLPQADDKYWKKVCSTTP